MIAFPKGPSRLQRQSAARRLSVMDDAAFKRIVWRRDAYRCRKCGSLCRRCLARVRNRGEVHHLHSRIGDFRFEDRCAILLCCACHEQVTGRVNEKWIITGTTHLTIGAWTVIDARATIQFHRVA